MKGNHGFGKLTKSIIAIGNPIIDISAEVDEKSIEKFGLQWGGTVFVNDQNIGIFDLLEKTQGVTYIPGGSIENSLRVASWCLNMNVSTKGQYQITMLGCLGNDEYRDKILKALKDVGVNGLMQIDDELPTSRCGCAIFKKERSLVPAIKASNKLNIDFVEKNIKKILKHDCFIVEGYFLVEKIDIIKYIVNEFKAMKKTVVLTIAATFIVDAAYDKLLDIAKDSDVIVCNLEEAEAFAKVKCDTPQDTFKEIHKKIGRKDGRLLVVTCASRGVFCSSYDYDGDKLDYVLQCFPKFLKNEDIVDTNGAGDAFLGGFLAQWMQGKGPECCCKAGNQTAGVILRNVGCTFPKNDKLIFEE